MRKGHSKEEMNNRDAIGFIGSGSAVIAGMLTSSLHGWARLLAIPFFVPFIIAVIRYEKKRDR